ncbi:MAG: hypothetical protein AB7K24_13520 [Gemmataceae bacterium]
MPVEPSIIEVNAFDYYWSQTLQKNIYSYRCPKCNTWGYVLQSGDVLECPTCHAFLRVVRGENLPDR